MVTLATAPRSDTARVNGVELQYLDWGRGSGSDDHPIFLVHGLGAQGRTWDPIAAVMAAGRRVVTPDLRGHGASGWATDGYHLERFCEDIVALADVIKAERVDYVGHSFGAQVGLAVAGARPDLVARLVVNDMGPEMATASVDATRATVADVKGFRSLDHAIAHYTELHPEWRRDFVVLHAEHQLRENWAGKWVPRADPDLFWLLGSAGRRSIPHVWTMTERIEAPTLLIWCRRSKVLDADIVGRMEAAVDRLEVRRVDAGHYFPREDPDHFIDLVAEFLSA